MDSLPLPPVPVKMAKKAKKRPVTKEKKKKHIKKSYSFVPYTGPPIKFEAFNIFPDSFFKHPRLIFLMSFFTKSVTQQKKMLREFAVKPFANLKSSFSYTAPDTVDAFWSPSLVKGIKESLQKVRTYRFILRKFLHLWRFKRLPPSNTEDIVTLAVPTTPIWIVDWLGKRKYCFEASTLMKDITSRLLEHDGFFEDPQPPRNPLTNIPLTQTQSISIWNQLYASACYPSTVFAAYRRVNYCMDHFTLENSVYLQIYAFRQTMKDPTHIDSQERLMDFIEYAYDQESVDCYIQSFKHAIQEYSDHEILKSWVKICLEFYEVALLHSRNPQQVHHLQDSILNKTIPLLPRQDELRLLRNTDMRMRRSILPRRHQIPL